MIPNVIRGLESVNMHLSNEREISSRAIFCIEISFRFCKMVCSFVPHALDVSFDPGETCMFLRAKSSALESLEILLSKLISLLHFIDCERAENKLRVR